MVTEVKYLPLTIPDEFLKEVKPKPPISKEEYLTLEPSEREAYLAKYVKGLFIDLHGANKQITSIRELYMNYKEKSDAEQSSINPK